MTYLVDLLDSYVFDTYHNLDNFNSISKRHNMTSENDYRTFKGRVSLNEANTRDNNHPESQALLKGLRE